MKHGFLSIRPRPADYGAASQRGFTLIEVVTVTAIIGILAAIAIPNYTAYIQRGNRSDARTQLMMAAQFMERFRNESGSYAAAALPAAFAQSPPPPAAARYNIALGNLAAGTYTLTATAVGAADNICNTMSVTHTGAKQFTTIAGGSMDICWNR